MLNRENLVKLATTVARADASAPTAYSFNGESFSYEALEETLRAELNEYAGTYALYRENKNLIFSVLEETLDEILPKKVQEAYSKFAEVKTYRQGDKPIFRRKLSGSKRRAKQFITKVGLAGIYEVFKLGAEEIVEVPTSAIGGAAQIGLEEFLDGRVDFSELLSIVMEGMDELVYQEVSKALIDSINQLPANNKVAVADFDEAAFDRLIAIASAYGDPTIYCSYDFAVKMIPSKQWMYTDKMKEELWNNGYFTQYKGKKVIILPNGIKDETNTERVIDPGYVWIIPSGGDSKPVKIAFEGNTIIDEFNNYDRSRDVHVYKKVGIVALMTNNICSYIDTSLQGKLNVSDMYASNHAGKVTE